MYERTYDEYEFHGNDELYVCFTIFGSYIQRSVITNEKNNIENRNTIRAIYVRRVFLHDDLHIEPVKSK